MQWDPCQLCSPEHYDSRGAYHDIPGEQHMMRGRERVREREGGVEREGGIEGGKGRDGRRGREGGIEGSLPQSSISSILSCDL